jgi:hypothetical protein
MQRTTALLLTLGLLLGGLLLAGCTAAPAGPVPAPTSVKAAATERFEERIKVGAGEIGLRIQPVKVGPATFTIEASGGLTPTEVQVIMAEMGHGHVADLKPDGNAWKAVSQFEMDGKWMIRVKAKDATGKEETALFFVKVRPQ